MAAPIDWLTDFVSYLCTTHSAGTIGTNVFRFQYPSTFAPSSLCTVVSPIGGTAFDKGIGVDFPSVQILHRCQTVDTAWDAANALYHRLKDAGPVRLGSAPYTLINSVRALQVPYVIGQDEARAWVISASYELDLLSE